MKLIKTIDELNMLIKKQFKAGVITNNFLKQDTYIKAIKNNNVFYNELEDGLILYYKKCEYWNIKYYLNNLDSNEIIEIPKISLIEIPVNPRKNNIEKIKEYWSKQGFEIYTRRTRFVKKYIMENSQFNNEIVKKCKKEDIDTVLEIFNNSFDKYSGCIPDLEEMKEEILNENIFCIKDIKNRVVAVLQVEQSIKQLEMKHLAVKKEFRGKTFGETLLKFGLNMNSKDKILWTGENNEIAKKLYFKNGFEEDGYISFVLIKR